MSKLFVLRGSFPCKFKPKASLIYKIAKFTMLSLTKLAPFERSDKIRTFVLPGFHVIVVTTQLQ